MKLNKIFVGAAVLGICLFFFLRPAGVFSESKEKLCDKALALMERGDFDQAKVYLSKALAEDPRYSKADYAMAVAYLRQAKPDIDKAILYKETAKNLGYVIPKWFDDYLVKLRNKKTK